MFEVCDELVVEYHQAQERLVDPSLHADPNEARRVARRHAELKPIVATYQRWLQLGDDVSAAQELAEVDAQHCGA